MSGILGSKIQKLKVAPVFLHCLSQIVCLLYLRISRVKTLALNGKDLMRIVRS